MKLWQRHVDLWRPLEVGVWNKQRWNKATCTLINVKMSTEERMEIRGNIKVCMNRGKTPTKTYKMLQVAKGECKVNRALVFKMAHSVFRGRLASNYNWRDKHSTICYNFREKHIKSFEGILRLGFRMLHILRDSGLNDINDAYSILRHTWEKVKLHFMSLIVDDVTDVGT